MKPGRSLLVVTLSALLVLLFSQAAPAQLLKSTSQILTIGASTEDGFFDYSGGEKLWRMMPNGTVQEFTFTTKQTLVMTRLSVRFFASDLVAHPGPYRLYFYPVHDPLNPPPVAPAKFCNVNLDNINNASGDIVGGSKTVGSGVAGPGLAAPKGGRMVARHPCLRVPRPSGSGSRAALSLM